MSTNKSKKPLKITDLGFYPSIREQKISLKIELFLKEEIDFDNKIKEAVKEKFSFYMDAFLWLHNFLRNLEQSNYKKITIVYEDDNIIIKQQSK